MLLVNSHVLPFQSTVDHRRSGEPGRIVHRRSGSARARDILVDYKSIGALPRVVCRGRSSSSSIPRCLNCHPVGERPTQGNDSHPHSPLVVRAADDKGAIGSRCTTCHQNANYEPSGVPGHPLWHVAPKSMAWQTKTLGPDLRADQGPAAQWRKDTHGDPRAHGARLAGGLGVDAGRQPRARARHAGTAGGTDRCVDPIWSRLPRNLRNGPSGLKPGASYVRNTQHQWGAPRSPTVIRTLHCIGSFARKSASLARSTDAVSRNAAPAPSTSTDKRCAHARRRCRRSPYVR